MKCRWFDSCKRCNGIKCNNAKYILLSKSLRTNALISVKFQKKFPNKQYFHQCFLITLNSKGLIKSAINKENLRWVAVKKICPEHWNTSLYILITKQKIFIRYVYVRKKNHSEKNQTWFFLWKKNISSLLKFCWKNW